MPKWTSSQLDEGTKFNSRGGLPYKVKRHARCSKWPHKNANWRKMAHSAKCPLGYPRMALWQLRAAHKTHACGRRIPMNGKNNEVDVLILKNSSPILRSPSFPSWQIQRNTRTSYRSHVITI